MLLKNTLQYFLEMKRIRKWRLKYYKRDGQTTISLKIFSKISFLSNIRQQMLPSSQLNILEIAKVLLVSRSSTGNGKAIL
jgi:hypothetical protein